MVKIVFQQLFILTMQLRLKQSVDWLAMISFEAYSMWSTLAILGFYFSSNAMDWKGRKYD
jgi:hypothetical protein